MRVELSTRAGRSDRPNEDFVGAVPGAAVLVDGAGISGVEAICRHGIAWYAHRLGTALLAGLSRYRDRDRDLASLLGDAIAEVADTHRDTCDIADPSSPSATVVAVRCDGDRLDHLVLADSLLVLDRVGDVPLVVADEREVRVGRPLRAAVYAAPPGTDEYDRVLQAARTTLRASRNQPGGFWVAKDDPRAAEEAVTGSVPVRDLAGAALLSNGVTCLVDRYGLADWPEVLELCGTMGPAEVIRRVREAEAGDPDLVRWPRSAIHDDATVAYCTRLSGA